VSFDRPLALVALVVVPALVALWRWNERRRRAGSARFASLGLVPNLVDRAPGRLRYVPLALLLLGLVALVVGAAKPHAKLSVPRKEALVVLEIDVSRSMGASDVKPTRLLAALDAADQFLDQIPKTYEVALVDFASRAYLAVPPTRDRELIRGGINELHAGEGTAIGDAVLLGAQLSRRHKTAEGTPLPTSILVISDGAPMGGRISPTAAARKARALGVPVSTVLVGSAAGVVVAQLTGGYTERIRVPASPGTLQLIAKTSGGTFYRARTAKALSGVYRNLATRLGHTTEDRQVSDVFGAGAGVLLLVGGGLSALWFRRLVP
jgi:Ca-activated chloride channel family protein